jgi:hypothetical protein
MNELSVPCSTLEGKPKFKIAHIMPIPSSHTGIVINMTRRPEFDDFDMVYYIKDAFFKNDFPDVESVIVDPDLLRVDHLKSVIDSCSCVIFHSMPLTLRQLAALGRKRLKKCVWITWGHDLYVEGDWDQKSALKIVLKRLKRKAKFYYLKDLFGIGVGFKMDILEIRKLAKDVRILNLPYPLDTNVSLDCPEKKGGGPVRVMIGHCCYPFLNHKANIDRLLKFRNENILLSFITSYGEKPYAEEVIRYATEKFGKDKVENIDQFMEMDQYGEYLKSVDIAILDYRHQSGLGNFYQLCAYGTKLYLNPEGVLYKVSNLDGLSPHSTEQIAAETFAEFAAPESKSVKNRRIPYGRYHFDRNVPLQLWVKSCEIMKKGLSDGNQGNCN